MKFNICCLLGVFICCNAAVASDILPAGGYYERETQNCDMAAMRRELDDATASRRAVVTVVKCGRAPGVQDGRYDEFAYDLYDVHADKYEFEAVPIERVVSRRYFVEETVAQYVPVVHYEPAGTYTRRCEFDCAM